MAVSATAGKKETQFLWEGKDKRGNKVRGKSLAANEAALRADLRRQGVAATKVKTPSNAFRSGGKVLPMDEIVSRYYVRLNVVDQPGVLAKIAAILASAKIGISSVVQPEGHEGASVPLILMTHDASNTAMRQALVKIAKLPTIKSKPVMIRVETFE